MSNQVLEEGVEGLNQDGQDERMSGIRLLRYARNDKQWWVALRLTHPTNSLFKVEHPGTVCGEREINFLFIMRLT